MSFDKDKLYQLLPAIYRHIDAEQGESLKHLLALIAEQVAVIEENLEQLYADQFIETCADWVIPYIGDLVGYRLLSGVTPQVSSPRAEVANTIGYRRRKGTASVIEEMARDVTGWHARVVEFFQLLAVTQHVNHLRPGNSRYSNGEFRSLAGTVDLRQGELLENLDGVFDSLAHTADMRSIARERGKHNIPNTGVFLWPLGAYPHNDSPAFKLDERCYLFSPLGHNLSLVTLPKPTADLAQTSGPFNVPMPISRYLLNKYLEDYYGPDKSLLIKIDGEPVKPACLEVRDLSDGQDEDGNTVWANMPGDKDKIAIDPELGRIAFPCNQDKLVQVRYHYGFSDDLGGGEYKRNVPTSEDNKNSIISVGKVSCRYSTVQEALQSLNNNNGVVEIKDSDYYRENINIQAAREQQIELRAAGERRPTLALSADALSPDRVPVLEISGDGAEVTISGLLICNGLLRVSGGIRQLRLTHCTLVPGLSLDTNGRPQHPDSPSLVIETAGAGVEIEHCITGGLRVVGGVEVCISNSIVDATRESGVAYAGLDGLTEGGKLTIENSTVIGKVHTESLERAGNTIFLACLGEDDKWAAPVWSEKQQQGCVRFSYVPLEASLPGIKLQACQPENHEQAVNIRPLFRSLRYGDPEYCRLSRRCAVQIRQGAGDEAEMGVFHDLYQPQREANLRLRLSEYLRFGLEAGIFYESLPSIFQEE